MASIPTEGTFPNGVTHEAVEEGVLVTDSRKGAIWHATADGAEVWFDHEVLDPNPDAGNIGVNGIAVGPDGDLYVANLDYGAIVRIPVSEGSPGEPETVAEREDLTGADGVAVADDGTVYTAVNAADKVSRVTPDGTVETVAQGGELAFPSDVHFGPGDDQSTLYVCNFAFAAFQSEDETADPSLMRLDLGGAGEETTATGGDATTTESGR
jgi:sugar lactone lactonase YvrE